MKSDHKQVLNFKRKVKVVKAGAIQQKWALPFKPKCLRYFSKLKLEVGKYNLILEFKDYQLQTNIGHWRKFINFVFVKISFMYISHVIYTLC